MDSELLNAAKAVSKNAHAPYSGFHVAAAVLTSDNKIFAGVNVENASYGGTICAERSAIFTAVTQGHKKISKVLVYLNQDEAWPPCGFCRQVMSEFMAPEGEVLLANSKGVQKKYTMAALLPEAFNSEKLK